MIEAIKLTEIAFGIVVRARLHRYSGDAAPIRILNASKTR